MESNSSFTYSLLIFSIVLMMVLPLMITTFVPSMQQNDAEDIMDDYYRFTGATGVTSEAVWVLTGVYTPYEGDSYNYTDDGWLYGARVNSYAPSQYQDTLTAFEVMRDPSDGIYRYRFDTADYDPDKGIGHRGSYGYEDEDGVSENHIVYKRNKPGDIYTSIVFEPTQQSDIFFSASGKHNAVGDTIGRTDKGPFYYDFSGWRYSFQPMTSYKTVDQDGNQREVIATTTSLNLVWYYFYTANGIAGQLVLSGSDQGVAYLTGDQIVRAFDSTTSTARFSMVFNGVEMGVYVRIDPQHLSAGETVSYCYERGYWSLMVTSITTDIDSYIGTDYDLNIFNLFKTLIDLLTFNYADYGMDSYMGMLCSFFIVIPLYAGLISLATGNWIALALVGLIGAIQGIAAIMPNLGSIFGVVDPNSLIYALSILGMG